MCVVWLWKACGNIYSLIQMATHIYNNYNSYYNDGLESTGRSL